MESGLIAWLISLISGGVGGNVAGALVKDKNPLLGNVGSSAIVGLLLPLIVSFFKKKTV